MLAKWFWFWVSLAVIAEVAADVLFKFWATEKAASRLAYGLVFYGAGSCLWAWSLRHGDLAQASIAFTVLNMLIAVAAGIIIFQDKMPVKDWIGLLLCVAGLLLIGAKQ